MEMFVDSSDWVMVPNVYGMGLFSDGGIFATKPYICGSSYFMKMMDFKKGEWCNTMDGPVSYTHLTLPTTCTV